MDVYHTLLVLEKTFINSTNDRDKILALQQKFIYVLHKKDFLEHSTKYKLYMEALDILCKNIYPEIHDNVKNYINEFSKNID